MKKTLIFVLLILCLFQICILTSCKSTNADLIIDGRADATEFVYWSPYGNNIWHEYLIASNRIYGNEFEKSDIKRERVFEINKVKFQLVYDHTEHTISDSTDVYFLDKSENIFFSFYEGTDVLREISSVSGLDSVFPKENYTLDSTESFIDYARNIAKLIGFDCSDFENSFSICIQDEEGIVSESEFRELQEGESYRWANIVWYKTFYNNSAMETFEVSFEIFDGAFGVRSVKQYQYAEEVFTFDEEKILNEIKKSYNNSGYKYVELTFLTYSVCADGNICAKIGVTYGVDSASAGGVLYVFPSDVTFPPIQEQNE